MKTLKYSLLITILFLNISATESQQSKKIIITTLKKLATFSQYSNSHEDSRLINLLNEHIKPTFNATLEQKIERWKLRLVQQEYDLRDLKQRALKALIEYHQALTNVCYGGGDGKQASWLNASHWVSVKETEINKLKTDLEVLKKLKME